MLMADMQLREQSGGLQTLDTALSALFDCCMENGKTWRAREMFVQLDKLTETNTFMELYLDHLHSNGFPDLQPVLKDLGVGIREISGDSLLYWFSAGLEGIRQCRK